MALRSSGAKLEQMRYGPTRGEHADNKPDTPTMAINM